MTRLLALPILVGLLVISAPRASAQGVVDQSNATGPLLLRSEIKPTAQSFTMGRNGSLLGADLWVTKQGTGTEMTVSVGPGRDPRGARRGRLVRRGRDPLLGGPAAARRL